MATEGYAFKTMIHGKVRNFKNNTKSVNSLSATFFNNSVKLHPASILLYRVSLLLYRVMNISYCV